MKWWNIKRMCLLMALLLGTAMAAQEDSITIAVKDYRAGWGKLIPKYGKLQYAGSMGFLSLGAGYDYGAKCQWESELFLGYLPHFSTRKNKITVTVKQNYIPWKVDLNKRWMVEPLTTGMYLTTIFNDDFWISEPEKYPTSYYAFSKRLRINAFVGQRITYKLHPDDQKLFKSITAYYEISTNDLYLLSAFNNSYLTPQDYLVLSLGVKMQVF